MKTNLMLGAATAAALIERLTTAPVRADHGLVAA